MDKYQSRALKTWHRALPSNLQRDHAVLGLVGEAGEVAEQHKKARFKPGHVTSRDSRLDELGDVFYYVCILAHLDGCTIEELSARNAAKLEGGHGWIPDYHNGE